MGALRRSKPGLMPHDLFANAMVILAGLFVLVKIALSLNESGVHGAGLTVVGMAFVTATLLAYVVVVTRRPSLVGWVVVGMEALILGCATFGSSISVPVPSTIAVLGGASIVFGPLLILWLTTRPRALVVSA